MTSAAPAPLAALADFSDRLSPMVVKELRQGLRTRMFRSVLLILHLLLVVITLITGAARNPDDVRWMLDGLTTLALCVALPLCGFSALSTEIKAKTLETLVLTRLSAARIVFGKWASLALPSLLVAFSLMPYFVARYVYGGANLLDELGSLGGQWLVGLVIAAGIVCLSTQKQFWLRAIVVVLMLMGPGLLRIVFLSMGSASFTMASGTYSLFFTAMGSTLPAWAMVGGMIAAAAWVIFFFLSLAATRIAPAASHLAVVKRSVHALTVGVLILLAWWQSSLAEAFLVAAASVVSLASLDALIEIRNEVPSLLIPFYRRGIFGRILAWLLTPGWPNGVFYSVTLAVLLTGAVLALETLEAASRAWLTVAGTWLCAVLLHLSSARRWRDMLAPYIGISIFVSLIQSLLMIVSNNPLAGSNLIWLGLALPGTAELTVANSATLGDVNSLRIAAMMLNSLWPLLLILLAAWSLRQTRQVRTEGRLLAVAS